MGSFRLFLAICVLLSHVSVFPWGYNIGVVAVIPFLLISGYVMTLLIEKHYASMDRLGDFYIDRAARLFPQFLFYSLLTGLLIATVNAQSFFLGGCRAYKIALNLLILPVDFWQFPVLGLQNCILLPQAWSLGLEMCFYAVAPVIIFLPKMSRWLVVPSVMIFIIAYFGLINTDTYGFRLLPGVLFIFIAGSALANRQDRLPWQVWAGAIVLFIALVQTPRLYALIYNKEVLLGLIIGIPALALLRDKRFSDWDERLGNFSYGMFLNHFFCIWLMQSLFGIDFTRIRHIAAMLLLSAALAILSYYLVEVPALKWRRAIRYRPVLVSA